MDKAKEFFDYIPPKEEKNVSVERKTGKLVFDDVVCSTFTTPVYSTGLYGERLDYVDMDRHDHKKTPIIMPPFVVEV